MTRDTIIAVHQILREDLFEQLRTKERIDTKISIIAGFNALILVLCLEFYPDVNTILFGIGISLLVISLGLLFQAYKTYDWLFSPKPRVLIQELNEGKKIEDIYKQTIGDIGGVPNEDLGAFTKNEKRINYKARWLNICTYILFMGLIIITISRIVG